LATADAAGHPHVVPLCFALAGAHLYFVVDAKPKNPGGRALKRMRNIAENPHVAVVADDYAEDWTALAYCMVRGDAAIVTAAGERRRALAALRARYPQYCTMSLDGPAHPVVRITPRHVHLWRASAPLVTRRGDGAPALPRVAPTRRPKPPRPPAPRRPR